MLPSATVWTLLPFVAVDFVISKTINSFAGPFIAYGNTFDPCPSDGSVVVAIRASHFNRQKPFELQRITGNFTTVMDVLDSFRTRVDLATRSNNEWKENAFIFNFANMGCTVLRSQFPNLFRILAKLSGASLNATAPCLIPKGNYVVDNQPISWTFPNFPVMPYGRYRMRIRAHDMKGPNQNARFCLAVDCEIIPKP